MKTKKKLAQRILTTLALLLIARMGIFIPVPGIDHDSFYSSVGQNALVNFLNMFSGGGFSTVGIFALGIVPYINSSIIIQLLSKIIPELENLQKEDGESGRRKITQITRYLTLLWAILQSFAISLWLKPYVFNWNINFIGNTIITLSTGSMIIMWFSEVITEYGIGNGPSLLIFQNIVSNIPKNIQNSVTYIYDWETIKKFILIINLFLIMLVVTILIQEGTRKINIISARQIVKKNELDPQSYIPLKINQGGVMPIVFSSAAMSLPAYLIQILENTKVNQTLSLFAPGGLLYIPLYGTCIILFSYFYSSLVLNPQDISKNLKKMGASIPNIRPGANTKQYLTRILNRLTFLGAIFLFFVALVPSIIASITHINAFKGLGTTSILILVGVAIDTAKQIQTYIISQQYDNMME